MRSPRPLLLLFLVPMLSAWMCPELAAGPSVEARISLEKDTYQVGEPIFLLFEVMNSGDEPIAYMPPIAFGECAALFGLHIEVERAAPARQEPYSCFSGYAGSCMGGYRPLSPHKGYTHRILLNQRYRFDRADYYRVTAAYELKFGSPMDPELSARQIVDSRLAFSVVEGDPASLEAVYAPLVATLQDEDLERRWTAQNALAVMAPPFLEAVLLQLAQEETPLDVQLARGLARLNTPATREALARFAQEASNPNTREEAVRLLGQVGDRGYLPLLHQLAETADPSVRHQALAALGRLGREDALPLLRQALRDKDAGVKQYAIIGLANTVRPEAIPLLIGVLGDDVDWLRRTAADALSQLTHRTVRLDVRDPALAATASQRWLQWWMVNGEKAELFGPSQCASPQPIP